MGPVMYFHLTEKIMSANCLVYQKLVYQYSQFYLVHLHKYTHKHTNIPPHMHTYMHTQHNLHGLYAKVISFSSVLDIFGSSKVTQGASCSSIDLTQTMLHVIKSGSPSFKTGLTGMTLTDFGSRTPSNENEILSTHNLRIKVVISSLNYNLKWNDIPQATV